MLDRRGLLCFGSKMSRFRIKLVFLLNCDEPCVTRDEPSKQVLLFPDANAKNVNFFMTPVPLLLPFVYFWCCSPLVSTCSSLLVFISAFRGF